MLAYGYFHIPIEMSAEEQCLTFQVSLSVRFDWLVALDKYYQ